MTAIDVFSQFVQTQPINFSDHYWARKDGRVYSSKRQGYVPNDDPDYLDWLASGKTPSTFPPGPDREDSENELRNVLRQHGLVAFEDDVPPDRLRAGAYKAEADAFRDDALSYQVEADAWRLAGNDDKADKAQEKADAALKKYLERKEAIRTRLPDIVYRINTAGSTYHKTNCSYASGVGSDLTLAELAEKYPAAKACSRCNPPALDRG